MPSELQRVAQGLVECIDQVPHLVALLQHTAHDMRQQAAYLAQAAREQPGARIAAMQLDHAARACEEAAHYAAQAPPKAHAWATAMVGGTSPHNVTSSPDIRPADGTAEPGDTGRSPERSTDDTDAQPFSPKVNKAASDEVQGPMVKVTPSDPSPASEPKPASFGRATSKNYRETFFAAFPSTRGKVVVHHAVEQQVLIKFPEVITPEQLHSLENLRGIPKGDVNSEVHLSAIRKEWNRFYKPYLASGTTPTEQELLDFATKLDNKYGHHFNPRIR